MLSLCFIYFVVTAKMWLKSMYRAYFKCQMLSQKIKRVTRFFGTAGRTKKLQFLVTLSQRPQTLLGEY